MAISQCPRCKEKVTVPAGGRPESKVRCPMCLEEYKLGEALELMPPTLILLDAPVAAGAAYYAPQPAYAGAAMAGAPAGGFGADDFGGGAEFGGAGVATFDDQAELGLEPMADQGVEPMANEEAATEAAPARRKKASKPRKKVSKNPLMEGVKIVGGGIFGIAAAILILFWIPNFTGVKLQRQQRDPISIASKLAQYAPFLVPEDLREEPKPPAKSSNKSSQGGNKSNNGGEKAVAKNDPMNGKPKANEFEIPADDDLNSLTPPKTDGIGQLTFDTPATPAAVPPTDSKDGTEEMPAEPKKNSPNKKKPAEPAVVDNDPFGLPDTTKPEPTKPEPVPPTTDEPKPEKPAAPASVAVLKSIPQLPEDAIEKDQIGFLDASEAWTTMPADADIATKTTRLASLYAASAKLAETVTLLSQKAELAPAQEDDAKIAFEKIVADENTAKPIGNYARRWLGLVASQTPTQRSNNGAALIGTVKDVKPEGKYWLVEIQLSPNDKKNVVVVTTKDPKATVAVDGRVAVLGLLVNEPAANLADYTRDDAQVVLSGIVVPMKAAN